MSNQPSIVGTGRHLQLVRTGRWEFVRRTKASGVVIVVAITPNQEILFVKQMRPAVEANVIEFPAGLAGDIDSTEPLANAAQRELVEETGYRAGVLRQVFQGPSSAGLTDETVSIFVADDLVREAAGGGVEGEDITNFTIPLSQVDDWLSEQQQSGTLVGARVYSGLYLLQKYLATCDR